MKKRPMPVSRLIWLMLQFWSHPPFAECGWGNGKARWLKHALDTLDVEYMALLMNWGWPGAGGLAPFYAAHPPARVYLMRWQGAPPMLNGWFVWDKAWKGETVLRMLDRKDARQGDLFAEAAEMTSAPLLARDKDVRLHGSFGERPSRFGRCEVACPSPIQRSRSHSGRRPTPTGPFLALEAMQGLKNRADGTRPSGLAEVNPNRMIEFYSFHDGNNNDLASMFRGRRMIIDLGILQNARFSSGFNECAVSVERRPMAIQNFKACVDRVPVARTSARPADIQQGLSSASRACDRPDSTEIDLDCLCKSFVRHFHFPSLGQPNNSTDPKFRRRG